MRPISNYEAYGVAYDQRYGYSLTLSFRFPKLSPESLNLALSKLYQGTGALQCVFDFKKHAVKLEIRPFSVEHVLAIGSETWQTKMQELHGQSFDYENMALFAVSHVRTPYFSDVIVKFHHAFVDGKSSLELVHQLAILLTDAAHLGEPSIPKALGGEAHQNNDLLFKKIGHEARNQSGFSLQVFDVYQTRVITDFCKVNRISLHSYLAQSIVNGIDLTSHVRTSVDLRPYVSGASGLGNYQSYATIKVSPNTDLVGGASYVRKGIKQALSDNQHIANLKKIGPRSFQACTNVRAQEEATVSLSTLGNFKNARCQILGAMTSFNRAYPNQLKVLNCIINDQLTLAYQAETGSELVAQAQGYLSKTVSNQQKGERLCLTQQEMSMKSLVF